MFPRLIDKDLVGYKFLMISVGAALAAIERRVGTGRCGSPASGLLRWIERICEVRIREVILGQVLIVESGLPVDARANGDGRLDGS